MRQPYSYPPVLEAICEFRFRPGRPWDWTVPGLIYAELRDAYPKRREKYRVELGFQEDEAESTSSLRRSLEFMQFLREDETLLVQVGRDTLTVNHLRPYSTWEIFRGTISRALDVYREITSPSGLAKLGVRYINKIEPAETRAFEIESYLKAVPTIPPELPQSLGHWLQRTEILLAGERILTLQSGSLPPSRNAGRLAFMLDLDCRATRPELVTLDDALAWVDEAHADVEKAFEACVTERSRGLFEEADDEPRSGTEPTLV